MSEEADAGLVEVYVNDSEDLVTAEEDLTIESETDFDLIIRLSGDYRSDSGDENLSVYSINVDIHFLNEEDPRDSCMMCAILEYQSPGDTEEDPGYDEYRAVFHSDSTIFEGYAGEFQIAIIMKNQSEAIVWDSNLIILLLDIDGEPDDRSGDSNTLIEDNTYQILGVAVGIVGLIIVAVVRTRSPTNVHDPYALPKSDDNYSPISYENDRRSDEVAKQIKTLEEPKVNKGTNGDDKFTKLQDLKTMYKEGLIDEGEFKKLKKEILD